MERTGFMSFCQGLFVPVGSCSTLTRLVGPLWEREFVMLQRSELCAYTSDQRQIMGNRFKVRTAPTWDGTALQTCRFCGDVYRRPLRSKLSLEPGACSTICSQSLREGLPVAQVPGPAEVRGAA